MPHNDSTFLEWLLDAINTQEPPVVSTHADRTRFENFVSLIKKFHLSQQETRRTMTRTKAVISGSAALALLRPGTFEPRDLDFYVQKDRCSHWVAFFLKSGYTLLTDDARCPPYHYRSNDITVFTFVHEIDQHLSINLIFTNDHPISTITHFHSTLVMNAITWYGTLCLYPTWTLPGRGLIVYEKAQDRGCFDKYRSRECHLTQNVFDLGHRCGDPAPALPCPSANRLLRDEFVEVAFFPTVPRDMEFLEPVNVEWSLPVHCPPPIILHARDN